MVIKVVVFDIGNVVLRESGRETRRVFAERFGFDVEVFSEFAKKNLGRSYAGELDAVNFFEELIVELGIDVDAGYMVGVWRELRREASEIDEDVVRLIGDLRGLDYIVGCFTNTTKLNDVVRDELGVYAMFDFVVRSTDIGFVKPDVGIYEKLVEVLNKAGFEASEVVFVDDKVANLEPALEMGIKTILFEGFESLDGKLIELGVEV